MFKQLGLWTIFLATAFGSGGATAEVTVQLRPDDTVRVTGDTDLQQVAGSLAEPTFSDQPGDETASVTVRFPRYSPAVYVLESGEPVDLVVDGWLPSGATLKVRAWHLTEQQFVGAFERTLGGDAGWSIPAEAMDALPVGHVQIQAVLSAPGLRNVEVTQRYVVLPAGTDLADAEQWYDPAEPDFSESAPRALIPGEGFTTFAPTPGAQVYYVSESGSDKNDGLSQDRPMRTLKAAYKRVGNKDGDWILVRAGDTLEGGLGSLTKSGKSADEPLLIGVYGQGPRPVILTSAGGSFLTAFGRVSNVVINGLHIYPQSRNPTDKGIGWYASGENLTIEDCKIEGYQNNIVVQGGKSGAIRNVTIRRCILLDAYIDHHAGHAQGIYIENTDNVLIDECTFDHNGWRPGEPGAGRTKFNHNIYAQTNCNDVKVYRSILARGASHGLQNRGGGDVVDNVFYRNAMAFFVRSGPSLVKNNVVLESDDIRNSTEGARGSGIEIMPTERAVVEGNIVAHKKGRATWISGIEVKWSDGGKEPFLVELRDNVVYNWPSTAGKPINITTKKAKILANTGNVADAASGGSSATRFVDPSRTLDNYLPGGVNEFFDGARNRQRGEWDPRYGAASFNAWMREGFKVRAGGA